MARSSPKDSLICVMGCVGSHSRMMRRAASPSPTPIAFSIVRRGREIFVVSLCPATYLSNTSSSHLSPSFPRKKGPWELLACLFLCAWVCRVGNLSHPLSLSLRCTNMNRWMRELVSMPEEREPPPFLLFPFSMRWGRGAYTAPTHTHERRETARVVPEG